MLRIQDVDGYMHIKDWMRYSYAHPIGDGYMMEFDDGDHITVSKREFMAQMVRLAQCKHRGG